MKIANYLHIILKKYLLKLPKTEMLIHYQSIKHQHLVRECWSGVPILLFLGFFSSMKKPFNLFRVNKTSKE